MTFVRRLTALSARPGVRYRGGSPYTEAHIRRLIDDSTGWWVSSNDTGYYQYYAGGSYITNTDGRCITWGGSISGYGWYSNQNGVFCD